MIRLNVMEHLNRMGKTRYWLNKQLDMSFQNFNKMVNNETGSIRYERLEALCQIFNCTPNDLLVLTDELPEK